MADFVDMDVLSYLNLLQRRCYIFLHSGASWKPEYGSELEAIDQQLAVYRSRIDEIHSREVL